MSHQRPQVVVVIARCRHRAENFGIRLEEKSGGQWEADWAFPIGEASAKREGYNQTRVAGSFAIGRDFPGCPSCESNSFFKCSCGKIACWDEARQVTCPWCRQVIQLSGAIDSLDAGADR